MPLAVAPAARAPSSPRGGTRRVALVDHARSIERDTPQQVNGPGQLIVIHGAGLTRGLRRQGRLIGANDLWIAAASVQHGLPLVTANPAEFGRVDGLQVMAYR